MSTFTSVATFTTIECTCGFIFAVPNGYEQNLRRTGETFYCPKGHRLHFGGETEAERLQRELDAEKRRTERAQADAIRQRDERIRAEHQLRTVKGHQTRLKKRIAAGVCPCCTRSFQNLARHMQHQHPDFPAVPA